VGVTGLGENCGRHRLGRLVGARVGNCGRHRFGRLVGVWVGVTMVWSVCGRGNPFLDQSIGIDFFWSIDRYWR